MNTYDIQLQRIREIENNRDWYEERGIDVDLLLRGERELLELATPPTPPQDQ